MKRRRQTDLARALRAFFAEHMPLTRGLSPNTVRSYRDAFTLLLRFLAARRGRAVIDLDLADLTDIDLIAYLDDLEAKRRNGVATRNARLAAIHSFARFVAMRHPGASRCVSATSSCTNQARPLETRGVPGNTRGARDARCT
jgi:site-specific recombinase XerD